MLLNTLLIPFPTVQRRVQVFLTRWTTQKNTPMRNIIELKAELADGQTVRAAFNDAKFKSEQLNRYDLSTLSSTARKICLRALMNNKRGRTRGLGQKRLFPNKRRNFKSFHHRQVLNFKRALNN